MMNFRNQAHEALARAKREIAANDDERLRYAALEIRFTMECLVYDRLLSVKDDIPPEEYTTWQPRKLMRLLAEIDPKLTVSSSIRYAAEDVLGELPKEPKWKHLGIDHVLSFSDLKKNYDAIGSFLHTPTLSQAQNSTGPSLIDLRCRCEKVVAILENILSSRVWNFTLGQYITFSCLRCKLPIRRRMPHGNENVDIRCFECNASYCASKSIDSTDFEWKPNNSFIQCQTSNCVGEHELWDSDISAGHSWECKECKIKHVIIYAVEVSK